MSKIVVVCIGTLNVAGDSLGPLVGDCLVDFYNIDAYVYGNTKRPVHGMNYAKYIEHIKTHHKNSFVIAVDACIGKKSDVGRVKLSMSGVNAGGALNKGFERIGDIGFLGIVAAEGSSNLQSLMDADPVFVSDLSERVASSIAKIVAFINARNKNRSPAAADLLSAGKEAGALSEKEKHMQKTCVFS